MAEEKKTEMLDPIAYRPDYNPNDIIGPQNANINYGQYGDDSNPEKQMESLGGLAEKNTGEGVANSNVGYNANIKTGDLDPNYLYGEDAKKQNAQEAGYIAKRNDNIASALYNEGKVTKDDVAMYLAQQNGFANSTVLDRKNTAESIYKRLGQFQSQNEQQEEGPDTFMDSTEGKIYGKTTAENQDPTEGINTLSDANSVFKAMDVARVSAFRNLQNMDSGDIAASIYSGTIPYGEQAFRDLQSYNFPKWQEVQDKIKELKVQDNVNKIANGDSDLSTSMDNGNSNINNSNADFASQNANDNVSSNEILESVEKTIASNTNANVASEQMAGIEEEVAILKKRLTNLRKEANNAFRGDVPDYIVQAYINNRTQEINDRLGILEDRYNAAYSRYQTELSNAQWQKEYDIKKREMDLKEKYYELDKYKAENGISSTSSSTTSTTTRTEKSISGKDLQMTNLTREEVEADIDKLIEMLKAGKIGKSQCAAGIQRYYLPMLGIDLGSLSAWEDKLSLINEEPGYMPKKGDIMIMSSQTSPMYGHMAIVTGVDEYGNIYYLDWNGELGADGKGTEEAKERIINGDSKTIAGFYNVTKGQGETSGDTSGFDFNEYDLSAFERFLKGEMNSAEAKTLAESWGTDLKGLRDLANKALKQQSEGESGSSKWWGEGKTITKGGKTYDIKNKSGNKSESSTSVDPRESEAGWNVSRGYNPYLKDVYEKLLSGETSGDWIANQEAGHNRKEGQLAEEAKKYMQDKENGVDVYSDKSRVVDENYGFVVSKGDVYKNMNKALGKTGGVPETQKKSFIQALGLNVKDPKAWEKAMDELSAYNRWSDEALEDNTVKQMIYALEYIMQQDATLLQRKLAAGGWETKIATFNIGDILNLLSGDAGSRATAYNYIKANQTLEELANSKGKGATLTPMSDKDLQAIREASSMINYSAGEQVFKDAIETYYNAAREAIGKNALTQDELDKMWNTEDDSSSSYENYLILNKVSDTDGKKRGDSTGLDTKGDGGNYTQGYNYGTNGSTPTGQDKANGLTNK